MKPWVIRTEQMAALAAAHRRRELESIGAHARRHFGTLLAGVSDDKLNRFVDRVATEAERHGLHAASDTVLFVNLNLALGERFWERPEYSWAREMLEGGALGSPSFRLRQLYAEAQKGRR